MSAPRRLTTTLINNACNELVVVQEGHRERLCTRDDVTHAIALYREAAMHARRLGRTGEARAVVDGGAVPMSYQYRAETTRITVTRGDVTVERVQARRVSGGDRGLVLRIVPSPEGMSARDSRIPNARKYRRELRW